MHPRLVHLFGRSLRARLVLLFSLVLVPPVLIAWGKAAYDYQDQRQSLQQLLLQKAKLVATERDDLVKGARSLLQALAELSGTTPFGQTTCEATLRNALMRNPEYQSLVVVDAEGQIACSSRPVDRALSLRDRDWFRVPMAGAEFFVSQPLVSRLTESWVLVASVPLRHPDGRFVGVIAAGIPWHLLSRPVAIPDLSSDALVALLDREGGTHPIANEAKESSRRRPSIDIFSSLPSSLLQEGGIVETSQVEWAVAPFAEGALFIALGRPRSSVDQELNFRLLLGLALPALIWVAAVTTAWLAANRLIVHWVLRVREYAASIAAGRPISLDERLGEAPRELQELATSLQRMMETIQQRSTPLAEALDHRETLIKEIHHRVKNNLQIIASLLNLQMRGIRDGAAREAMMTVHNRVNALALIHRSLYETDEMQRIEFHGFLTTLIDQVSEFLDAPRRNIRVRSDVPLVYVPAETAVTLALLATEALSNAFKHAFPAGQHGLITIRLETAETGDAVLTVQDNGIGDAPGAADDSVRHEVHLGHQLMLGYARQLGGTLAIEQDDGTLIRVELPSLNGLARTA